MKLIFNLYTLARISLALAAYVCGVWGLSKLNAEIYDDPEQIFDKKDIPPAALKSFTECQFCGAPSHHWKCDECAYKIACTS